MTPNGVRLTNNTGKPQVVLQLRRWGAGPPQVVYPGETELLDWGEYQELLREQPGSLAWATMEPVHGGCPIGPRGAAGPPGEPPEEPRRLVVWRLDVNMATELADAFRGLAEGLQDAQEDPRGEVGYAFFSFLLGDLQKAIDHAKGEENGEADHGPAEDAGAVAAGAAVAGGGDAGRTAGAEPAALNPLTAEDQAECTSILKATRLALGMADGAGRVLSLELAYRAMGDCLERLREEGKL